MEHEWARLFKDSKQYEKALEKYREILFEDPVDAQTGFKRLNDFLDYQTDIFSEIVKGIAQCLYATRRITESATIINAEAEFSKLKQQTGIYDEIERNYKLRVQKNSLLATLERILFNEPDLVLYKNIQAKYNPREMKATFKVDEKEIKMSRRYFLVFKFLVENAGKHVTGKMLDTFVIDQGESINLYDSGLRAYVARLKKDINLAQFFEPNVGKGWKLKDP